MKRIILAAIALLVIGAMAYAQQQGASGPPQSAETRQAAQQQLSQSRSNSSQFESNLADLQARNRSNHDADGFKALKAEIDRLEAAIEREETRVRTNLDTGSKISPEVFSRLERLINQHKARLDELEAFSRQQ